MSEHAGFLHMTGDLVFSGALRNIWPLALLPPLTALLSDWTARRLQRTAGAWIPAAILAAVPGVVALGVICPAATTWGTVITWRGLVLLRLTPMLAIGLFAYAVRRAAFRQREVARLFRMAQAPGPRLAAAAARLGLSARELPTDARECFVAGVLRPTVFVSSGALARLGDEELEAALCHERAHVRGGDAAMLFVLAFLRDLAPWGQAQALAAFHAARERLADREAAARAGPLSLASALVALARPGPTPAAVLPMADADSLRWRMQALLETGEAEPERPGTRAATVGGLVASLAMMAWPIAQFELWVSFC